MSKKESVLKFVRHLSGLYFVVLHRDAEQRLERNRQLKLLLQACDTKMGEYVQGPIHRSIVLSNNAAIVAAALTDPHIDNGIAQYSFMVDLKSIFHQSSSSSKTVIASLFSVDDCLEEYWDPLEHFIVKQLSVSRYESVQVWYKGDQNDNSLKAPSLDSETEFKYSNPISLPPRRTSSIFSSNKKRSFPSPAAGSGTELDKYVVKRQEALFPDKLMRRAALKKARRIRGKSQCDNSNNNYNYDDAEEEDEEGREVVDDDPDIMIRQPLLFQDPTDCIFGEEEAAEISYTDDSFLFSSKLNE